MEYMEASIKKDPTLPEKWRIEGEKRYQAYLQRAASNVVATTTASEIIIPVVFHLVDSAQRLAWITDRDIYEQVEILNNAYGGKKADLYKDVIPPDITSRVGRISLKFVLARRTPDGDLTTSIERRAIVTPDHISIKETATGGLDTWDDTKYLNVLLLKEPSNNKLLKLIHACFFNNKAPTANKIADPVKVYIRKSGLKSCPVRKTINTRKPIPPPINTKKSPTRSLHPI
jgi:hypothetical protein